MALLSILEYPDPRLHTVAKPIAVVDAAVRQLAADMLETMYAAEGVGLAATQVNQHRRLVVLDVSENRKSPLVLINPEIIASRGEVDSEEGCLSVPGIYDHVRRFEYVTVCALDVLGETFEVEAEGLLSMCLQHELDHLDGKVFVEKLSRLKLDRIKKKLKKRDAE